MDPGGGRRWVRDDERCAAQGEAPLGRDRSSLPLGAMSCSPSLGTEVPETLNQLCFIHFIRKGSFKIQLRNLARGTSERQAMSGGSGGGSSAGFNNL